MSDRRTPDLFVEQALLGEREASTADAARVAQLAESNADILKRYPPRVVGMRVRGQRQKAARAWALGGSLVVVAAALTLFVLPQPTSRVEVRQQFDDGNGGFVRPKGLLPTLHVFRVTDVGAQQLEPEASAHEGDRLQVSYIAAGANYGMVLSIDGRGTVTVHLPLAGTEAAALSKDGDTTLGASYALDDAPAYERFFLVTSDQPFPVSTVTTAANQLAKSGQGQSAPLSLPANLHQTPFLLLKR
jgi:hypothetical protein